MENLIEKLPIGTDREPFYRESQGDEGNAEILERYKVMINYFLENPHRATTRTNMKILTSIYYNDRVLMQNEKLREKLRQEILNSPEAKMERARNKEDSILTGGSQ